MSCFSGKFILNKCKRTDSGQMLFIYHAKINFRLDQDKLISWQVENKDGTILITVEKYNEKI